MKSKLLLVFTGIILSLLLINCSNAGGCHQNLYVVMTANLDTIQNDTVKTMTLDSVWVAGVRNDSVLYDNTASVSQLSLPLQENKNITQFVIRSNSVYDTLTCYHTNIQQYISLECGCEINFQLDSVKTTTHRIKSVQIVQKNVTSQATENIQIFY
ncbi:DUF6452 family protein [Microbacter margulisiae]|uniref:Lipoprotein n=1 Tax=Microbacter margulisiae TaxID=1350067 RepID=A0A7W5H1I1_9PORP|nr:DUF6452 family protein [Microbacter margulisiae]MBB3186725.1 hypothetical protein [Microbacter margulisiae]